MPSGGGGDYARWNGFYQSKNADVQATAGGAADMVVPKTANHQIWVQKIAWYGTGTLTAVDGAGVTIAVLDPTVDHIADFGPQGTPLTIGEELDITGTLTGRIHVEAYEKLAVPMAIGPNN